LSVSIGLQLYAEEVLKELMVNHPLPIRPKLEWRRFRTTAGIADFNQWRIGLSMHVLNTEERVNITLRHEFAHLLAFSRFGRQEGRGHGPAWRQAMCDVGLDPRVTHQYEVQRNEPRQTVVYLCLKCGMDLIRLRRLPRRRKYMHRGCGGMIQLKAVVPATINSTDS